MSEVTYKFDELDRIEKLGFLLHILSEFSLELDNDNIYRLIPYIPNMDKNVTQMWECREDWLQGIHNGDCVKMASSCTGCFWNEIVTNGHALSLAMTKNQMLHKNNYNLFDTIFDLEFDLEEERNVCLEFVEFFVEIMLEYELQYPCRK